MNINHNYKNQSIITSNETGEQCPYELPSSIQNLIENKQNLNNNNNGNNINGEKKKKKRRGNRNLQRFKRNYRKKGINDQTIEMLLSMHQAIRSMLRDGQIISEGKMEDDTLISNSDHNEKMSMSTENQDQIHRCQFIEKNLTMELSMLLERASTTGKWIAPLGIVEHEKVKHPIATTDHWKQSSKLIPNYLHMDPLRFKDFLSKAIPDYRSRIEECPENSKLLQFIQQRAHLLCTFFQLKIEQDYWKFVDNSITPVVIWLSEFSENVMTQNSINWDYTKTEAKVKRRQDIVENKLQETINNLYSHMRQPAPYPFNSSIQNETDRERSMNILFDALTVLVRNGLYYFLLNFQHKKILLNLDIHAIELVKSFYSLNPSENQLRTVQQIWRAKLISYKRTIRQRKKHSLTVEQTTNEIEIPDDRLSINDQILEPYHEHNHREVQLSSNDLLTPDMEFLVQARLGNIEERARKILEFINLRSE